MSDFKYDIYLFDWDNTLADTLSVWLRGYVELAARFGEELTRQEAYAQMYDSDKFFAKHQISKAQKNELMREAYEQLNYAELNPEAIHVIETLRAAGKKIGVVSSAGSTVKKGIKHHDIGHLIDTVVTANDVTKVKPDPEALLLALKHLDFDASTQTALYVGDAVKDIQAAHAANIDAAGYYWKEIIQDLYPISKFDGVNPDYLIQKLSEILNLSN